jgi:hypothetical protein
LKNEQGCVADKDRMMDSVQKHNICTPSSGSKNEPENGGDAFLQKVG